MNILVTGATGFVGSAVVSRLVRERRFGVRVAVRRSTDAWSAEIQRTILKDLARDQLWHEAVEGVHAVIHLAARVHVLRETAADPLSEFRSVNVAGTLNLARQAAAEKVRRFVFVSSIAVNGKGGVFREVDVPSPLNAYGISKHEAEVGLREIASSTGMEVVIIRPPLVYGPEAKGHFRTLVRAVDNRIPLPLGALHEPRSWVALDNLVDFILTCVDHPAAANETFLVKDIEDLSTTAFIRRLARAMNRQVTLIPVPSFFLLAGASVLGKGEVAKRLLSSIHIDDSKARDLLGWFPPISVDEGLRRVALSLARK